MRIGIDVRELCGQPTGVGRYLAHLLERWAHLHAPSSHEFILFAPRGGSHGPLDALTAKGSWSPEVVRTGEGFGTAWEQWHLPRAVQAAGVDVLFCPAYTGPVVGRTPLVLTIHDLSFIVHPEWFPARSRLRRRVATTLAARRARLVLTVSEFSRGEIIGRLGLSPSRVRTILHGLTAPRHSAAPAPGTSGDTARGPVVLYVGSIFNRRHVPELMAAVERMAERHPEVQLEVVGDNRTHPHQDLEQVSKASRRINLRAFVPDDELARLYASAGVFAFLSDYEGFGLTPLEALSNGLPVLVGDTPVAREIYGDAARYVATTDVTAIAGALESLLFDASARRAVLGAAPAVLGRYSWDRAARETLSAIEEAAHA
jgi:glycosyltransferase involved in cell wall biosynthesis